MWWIVLVDKGRSCAELGFILRPDAQGRGIAREALGAILNYGFETREFRRIFADVDPDNRRSIVLLETSGFEYEGRLRESYETHIGVRDSLSKPLCFSVRFFPGHRPSVKPV